MTDILATIDHAIEDWETSDDAMRWTPFCQNETWEDELGCDEHADATHQCITAGGTHSIHLCGCGAMVIDEPAQRLLLLAEALRDPRAPCGCTDMEWCDLDAAELADARRADERCDAPCSACDAAPAGDGQERVNGN